MADDNHNARDTNAPNPSANDADADKAARRPGPTIELSQGEFSSSTQDAAADAPSGPESETAKDGAGAARAARPRGAFAQWLYPPLAGAMVAGVVAGGFLLAGQRQAQRVAVPPAPASTPELVARITQLESIVAALPKSAPSEADPVLPARVSALEQSAQSARDHVAALRRQIETLSAALAEIKAASKDASDNSSKETSKEAPKETPASVAAPASAPASVPAIPPQLTADLADLQARLRAAEERLAQSVTSLAELAARPIVAPAPVVANPDPVLRLNVVAAMLDMQVRAGEPYAASLALAKKMLAEQGRSVNLSALDAFAEKGMPPSSALRASLLASIPAPKPPEKPPEVKSAAPQNATMLDEVWTKLSAHAAQVVRVRKVDQTAPEAVAPDYAPLAGALARNDLDAARVALRAMPEAQRAFAQRWLADMDARDKALAASSAFVADALAALGASAASSSPSTPSTAR